MGNCVRGNLDDRRTRTTQRAQYEYQPSEQPVPTTPAVPDQQDQQDDPVDESMSWPQLDAQVQHIADREGTYFICTLSNNQGSF